MKIHSIVELIIHTRKGGLILNNNIHQLNIDNKKIILIGTAHISKHSIDEVEEVIEVEKLLQELKEKNISISEEVKEIGFVERVQIKPFEIDINKSMSFEDALNYILLGGKEIQKYKVKSGDIAWDIAIKFDLGLEDLTKANPDINLDKLQIGQEISLNVLKPYINVKTIEKKNTRKKYLLILHMKRVTIFT